MIEVTLSALAGLVVAYAALNALVYFANTRYFRPRADYTSDGTLLVIVPHQDDETIAAAGAMQKTIAKGGQVHVIYTADGVNHSPGLSEEEIAAKVLKREEQATAALAMVKVPAENIQFLRYENEKGLTHPENMLEAMDTIESAIKRLTPYAIVIAAFEGGHIDHDTTNFVVSHAARRAGFSRDNIYEAPEYNRYYLRDSIKRALNRLLLVKLPNPPRFVPTDSPGSFLDMTQEELALKVAMFEVFDDWDPAGLIRAFGTADCFRKIPDHNYTSGPFDRSKTIRHWFARLRYPGSREAWTYFRDLGAEEYREIFSRAEAALASRESAVG